MSDNIDIKQIVADKARQGTSKRIKARSNNDSTARDKEGLTPKQMAFCEEYIKDYNGTRAAQRAGYSKATARTTASKLLMQDITADYIRDLQDSLRSSRIATAEEIQEFLTSAVRDEVEEEVIVVEGQGQGVSEGIIKTKKIAAKDRVKAAELLAKRYGLLSDKLEIEQAKPFEVNIQLVD